MRILDLRLLISQETWFTSHALDLVRCGQNPNTKNEKGESLIHCLVNYTSPIQPHNEQAIGALVRNHNADIEIKNAAGFTPLQTLMNRNTWYTQDALMLVNIGANVNTIDAHGNSLVHRLTNYGLGKIEPHNRDAINSLVKCKNADINIQNAQGLTPLETLINQNSWSVTDAEFLVSLGAKTDIKNKDGHDFNSLLAFKKLIEHLNSSIEKVNSSAQSKVASFFGCMPNGLSASLRQEELREILKGIHFQDSQEILSSKLQRFTKLMARHRDNRNIDKQGLTTSFQYLQDYLFRVGENPCKTALSDAIVTASQSEEATKGVALNL